MHEWPLLHTIACILNHTHLTYTSQPVISMYQWPLSLFHFEPYAFDVHTTVILMHAWMTAITHYCLHFEPYAFDVHITASNINVSMTAIIIPLWTIRIWRTHHSNTNAYMNDRYCSLLHFESYAFDVHTTVISCINDRYHYFTLNHTHLTYTSQ